MSGLKISPLMTAGSNTAGLSGETSGWVSPTSDQETHSQHFSASDLPLISEFPSPSASPRAMGQGRPHRTTQERQRSWIMAQTPSSPSLEIKRMVLIASSKPAARCEECSTFTSTKALSSVARAAPRPGCGVYPQHTRPPTTSWH